MADVILFSFSFIFFLSSFVCVCGFFLSDRGSIQGLSQGKKAGRLHLFFIQSLRLSLLLSGALPLL